MSVLGTKLRVPRIRSALVARDRLTDGLRGGPAPRLVLVAAPAGFGKTTLLSQWLGPADATTVAWLSLDAADADLRRFLTNLVAAVHTARPDTGAEAIALLASDTRLPTEDVLVSLVNDLDTLPGRTVLALDDYHVIDAAEVHEAVRFLLDNLPPQAILAIATRADPPLSLPRLRARGELLEVRAADLRFTEAEAAEFLNDVMGLGLQLHHVAALEQRTEGWAVGLQLAALSARSQPGVAAGVEDFVAAFTGTHRFVLDYLVEEVLDRQPDDVRSFLLDTSVLTELTGSLCDALTGRDDGQARLEALDRANLFVVALDEGRRWWRYHHLFADALRSRLTARDPDRVRWLATVLPALVGSDPGFVDDVVAAAAGGAPAGDIGPPQTWFMLSGAAYMLGGLLFGIALFRTDLLARWAAVLLAVSTAGTAALAVLPGGFDRPFAIPAGVAFIALGVSLWRTGRRTADATAAPRPVGEPAS